MFNSHSHNEPINIHTSSDELDNYLFDRETRLIDAAATRDSLNDSGPIPSQLRPRVSPLLSLARSLTGLVRELVGMLSPTPLTA